MQLLPDWFGVVRNVFNVDEGDFWVDACVLLAMMGTEFLKDIPTSLKGGRVYAE